VSLVVVLYFVVVGFSGVVVFLVVVSVAVVVVF
jgi:hypothetical protein